MSDVALSSSNFVQRHVISSDADVVRNCMQTAARLSQSGNCFVRHFGSTTYAAAAVAGNFFNTFLYVAHAPIGFAAKLLELKFVEAIKSLFSDVFNAARCILTTALGLAYVAIGFLFPGTVFPMCSPVDLPLSIEALNAQLNAEIADLQSTIAEKEEEVKEIGKSNVSNSLLAQGRLREIARRDAHISELTTQQQRMAQEATHMLGILSERNLEISNLRIQVSRLNEQVETKEAQILSINLSLKGANEELAALREEYDSLDRVTNGSVRQELKSLKAKILEKEANITRMNQQIGALAREANTLREQTLERGGELVRLNGAVAELEQQLSCARAANQELEADKARLIEKAKAQRELDDSQVAELLQQFNRLEKELASERATTSIGGLAVDMAVEARTAKLSDEITALRERLATLQSTFDIVNASNGEMANELEGYEKLFEGYEKLAATQDAIIRKGNSTIERLEQEIVACITEIEQLSEEKARLELEIETLSATSQDNSRTVDELGTEYNKLDDAKKALEDRLAQLEEQLQEKVDIIKVQTPLMQTQRETIARLGQQLDELQARITVRTARTADVNRVFDDFDALFPKVPKTTVASAPVRPKHMRTLSGGSPYSAASASNRPVFDALDLPTSSSSSSSAATARELQQERIILKTLRTQLADAHASIQQMEDRHKTANDETAANVEKQISRLEALRAETYARLDFVHKQLSPAQQKMYKDKYGASIAQTVDASLVASNALLATKSTSSTSSTSE